MCRALELEVDYSAVSNYELGTREPPLPVLLKYARLAGISTDVLIDDDLNLPEQLPAGSRYKQQATRKGRALRRR
jgi:transcriptional regulator with XRE-family HTH domain